MFCIFTPSGTHRRYSYLRRSLQTHFSVTSTHKEDEKKREKRNKESKDGEKLISIILN